MGEIKNIILSEEELFSLPLYYKKIYYNALVPKNDEYKLYYKSDIIQGIIVKQPNPRRDISKLLNYSPYYNDKL